MRIGILTYHRSHNYGALFQAIALRHVLVSMGHDVFFVDYWPEYHRTMYSLFSIRRMVRCGRRGSMKYLRDAIKLYQLRKMRITNMKTFITEQIEPYCQPYKSKYRYDVVIYGSDQIWRKQRMYTIAFDHIYFGDNIIQTACHISYAASMGIIKLNKSDEQFLKRNLSRFKGLSVREDELKDTLQSLGINSKLVLDPTLLLNQEEWEKMFPVTPLQTEKYVLYYRLLEKSFDEKLIQETARQMRCKLIILDGTPRKKNGDILCTSSPYEFLSLIKYAELVFTSSYHGLAFSLIFNKPFYASFGVNGGRAKSLLSILGLEKRMIMSNTNIKGIDKIDYARINSILDMLRKESLNFLYAL